MSTSKFTVCMYPAAVLYPACTTASSCALLKSGSRGRPEPVATLFSRLCVAKRLSTRQFVAWQASTSYLSEPHPGSLGKASVTWHSFATQSAGAPVHSFDPGSDEFRFADLFRCCVNIHSSLLISTRVKKKRMLITVHGRTRSMWLPKTLQLGRFLFDLTPERNLSLS